MKEDKNPLRKVHDELEDRVRERTAELALANKVLDAINRVFREALTCETEEELGKTCLAVAEELTPMAASRAMDSIDRRMAPMKSPPRRLVGLSDRYASIGSRSGKGTAATMGRPKTGNRA